MDKYMEKVDDDPNWSHQTNAGAESGLTATVATGLICPLVSNGKVYQKIYIEKHVGKCIEKAYGKAHGKMYMDKYMDKVDDGPNWSHQPNAGAPVV